MNNKLMPRRRIENDSFKTKSLELMNLDKELLLKLIKENLNKIQKGDMGKIELDEKLKYNLVSYLLPPEIKSWKGVLEPRFIGVIRHIGYLRMMLLVAIHAFVKYPKSIDNNERILRSLYDLREKVFLLRKIGAYRSINSNEISFDLFVKYVHEYYEMDLKISKKILDTLEK